LQVGDIVETVTYTSTSDPYVDPMYDKSGSFGDYHMKIMLPLQTHCFYYSVIEDDDDFSEHEVILPPGRMKYEGFDDVFIILRGLILNQLSLFFSRRA